MNVYSDKDHTGLADALHVARSGSRSEVTEGDEKLLGFFLRHGECDAWITEKPAIDVVFSWFNKQKPSAYFSSLAPGLLTQLMELGCVVSFADSVEFSIGPGSSGTNRYRIDFKKKWVWISCADDQIWIRVRDRRSALKGPLCPGNTEKANNPPLRTVGEGRR